MDYLSDLEPKLITAEVIAPEGEKLDCRLTLNSSGGKGVFTPVRVGIHEVMPTIIDSFLYKYTSHIVSVVLSENIKKIIFGNIPVTFIFIFLVTTLMISKHDKKLEWCKNEPLNIFSVLLSKCEQVMLVAVTSVTCTLDWIGLQL